jgi:predicted 3-demethylubiquinone-9 3-methyltransferase (glyoxalase superfamily)
MKHPIHPCLWFDGNAKTAADLYCSVFKNSKIKNDTDLVVVFEFDGQKIYPMPKPTSSTPKTLPRTSALMNLSTQK